jgi:hypothetical protein
MADNIVGTKIVIDSSQAVESVGSIKKQLREATNDLVTMADKFGEGSKEAVTAAKRVAELRDRIGDAKSMADAFNPDAKFKAVSQSVQGIAGAFAAVQGAMASFGVESEDLQKSLLKVQGALALSEGLNTFLDTGIQGFKNLKTVAIDAFQGIKAAIGGTGIGLLVVALGTIVAYWDDIKRAVSGVSEEQEKLANSATKLAEAEKDKLSSLNSQDNILKLQGKTEKDILNIKIKQTEQTITALEAQLNGQIALENAQIKAARRNKEILEGVLRWLFLPLSAILKAVDSVGSALGKDFGLEKGLFGGLSKLLFDPEAIKKDGDNANKELQKQILALKNTQAGYKLQLQEANKKETTKKEETKGKIEKIDLEPVENIQINAIDRLGLAYKKLDAVRAESTLKNQDTTAMNIKLAQDEANARRASFDESLKYATMYVDSAKGLSDALYAAKLEGVQKGSKEEEAILRKQFETNKKLQIAQTIMTGLNGVVNALSAKSYFLEPTRSILNGINAAMIGATTAATVSKISQTQFGGTTGSMSVSGGVGGNAPMTPNMPIQQTITQLNQGSINALGNQAIKAYVLESDVTNSQNRVTRILNSSRFK